MSKPTATVRKSTAAKYGYGWVVAFDLTGNPYERSWEFFKTREQARRRRRIALKKWMAWRRKLERAARSMTKEER